MSIDAGDAAGELQVNAGSNSWEDMRASVGRDANLSHEAEWTCASGQ